MATIKPARAGKRERERRICQGQMCRVDITHLRSDAKYCRTCYKHVNRMRARARYYSEAHGPGIRVWAAKNYMRKYRRSRQFRLAALKRHRKWRERRKREAAA